MKKLYVLLLFLIAIFPISVSAKSDVVKLSKCVDGDTAKFIINGKEYSTRFLAIDTPEVKHPKKGVEPFGKEASKYTCDSLEKANEIVLEYDNNSTEEDKYGRKLVWVFVDKELLQEKLVSKGYAKVAYLYDDYKYTKKLQEVEKKAKKSKLGVWSNQKSINDDYNDDYNDDSFLDQILDKIFEFIRKQIKSVL